MLTRSEGPNLIKISLAIQVVICARVRIHIINVGYYTYVVESGDKAIKVRRQSSVRGTQQLFCAYVSYPSIEV